MTEISRDNYDYEQIRKRNFIKCRITKRLYALLAKTIFD